MRHGDSACALCGANLNVAAVRRRRRQNVARVLAKGSPPSQDVADAALFAWLHARGATTSGVRVTQSATLGRELIATRTACSGDVLATLPLACQLLSHQPDGSRLPEQLRSLLSCYSLRDWDVRLALRLLHERSLGDASGIAPYLATLPAASFYDFPTFWSDAAVDELRRCAPEVVRKLSQRKEWFHSFLLRHGPLRFNDLCLDAAALRWAFAAVTSRAFAPAASLSDAASPARLCPLLEFCNHSFDEANVEVVSGDGDAAVLRATRSIQANEPLLLCYGALSNDMLLLDYNFTVWPNAYDTLDAGNGATAMPQLPGSLKA